MISGRCRIRIRYAETDAMSVAHHSRHLTWFEVGRQELMRAAGLSYAQLQEEGVALPVIGLEVRYLAPGRFDDLVEIETRMRQSHGTRLVFEYRLTRVGDGIVLATGSSEHAAVDRAFRPIRLPPHLLALVGTRRAFSWPEAPC
ncbi:MAG: acyl-CoA thioesterase [Acidobacteriota bacterium]